ncbi:hypothetical protein UPTC17655_a0040 (plasmid) [Campylobacter lari]|uniref:hypothetical protein n=1 Tax=Campylobacter lari TaxID=201 RepID=UPI0021530E9F|nr:hypothetical protein [Campylobacter lari]MCR6511442.1 hypothetical protein [Campylobacter lari]
MKKTNIYFDEKSYSYLVRLKKEMKVSFSKIINTILKNIYDNEKENINTIDKINYQNNEPKKEIRFKLTEDEYKIFSDFAKKNGNGTATKQIRILTLNHIYKDKFFDKNYIDEFILARTEINTIGRNIYQLLKILRSGKSVRVNEKNLEKSFEDISINIEKLSKELEKIILKNNERI